MDDECEFELGISFDARCVRCRYRRPVDERAEFIMDESSSDEHGVKTSVVVQTPEACQCGEKRVRIKVEMES